VEIRRYFQDTLGKCGSCDRILKVPMGRPLERPRMLHKHSVRGRNTASQDRTLEILWDAARPESTVERLAAEHGVRTREHEGQIEVWEEAAVTTPEGPKDVSGWRPAPKTAMSMLGWLGY
jgi:hypothetical protein